VNLNLDQLFWRHEIALLCNNVVWHYVKAPQKERMAAEVLLLAQKVAELEPFNSNYQNTLGVVFYRLGRYQDAVACLEPNRADSQELAAFDWYFLAMSYQRLGNAAKARAYFDRANAHVQESKNLSAAQVAELGAFRAEAAALLGLPEKPSP